MTTESVNHNIHVTPEVIEMGKIHFEGNVIPHAWYKKIIFKDGKPDLLAITILSEICYWYRPTYEKDEATGQLIGIRKKFKSDLLQRTKDSFAEQFGCTKLQVQRVLSRLESMGLIKRILRTVQMGDVKCSNVMFIQIFPKAISDLSIAIDFEVHSYTLQSSYPCTSKSRRNTENTTEITTNILSSSEASASSCSAAGAAERSEVFLNENTESVAEENILAQEMADQIKAMKPNVKKPNLKKWASELGLIIRIDKRTPEQIRALLKWIYNDKFWKTVILCPASLRQNWDKVELKMLSDDPTDGNLKKNLALFKKWKKEYAHAMRNLQWKGDYIVHLHNAKEVYLRSEPEAFFKQLEHLGAQDAR